MAEPDQHLYLLQAVGARTHLEHCHLLTTQSALVHHLKGSGANIADDLNIVTSGDLEGALKKFLNRVAQRVVRRQVAMHQPPACLWARIIRPEPQLDLLTLIAVTVGKRDGVNHQLAADRAVEGGRRLALGEIRKIHLSDVRVLRPRRAPAVAQH